jgi:hypothetical protein
MWDSSIFEVNSIEFGGQWISLCGKHVNSSINCMVVGYMLHLLCKIVLSCGKTSPL